MLTAGGRAGPARCLETGAAWPWALSCQEEGGDGLDRCDQRLPEVSRGHALVTRRAAAEMPCSRESSSRPLQDETQGVKQESVPTALGLSTTLS